MSKEKFILNKMNNVIATAKVDKEKRLTDIREKSGSVVSNDKLVSVLYLLLRDHVQPGNLEQVISECEYDEETVFSNGWLAEYAKYLAGKLK